MIALGLGIVGVGALIYLIFTRQQQMAIGITGTTAGVPSVTEVTPTIGPTPTPTPSPEPTPEPIPTTGPSPGSMYPPEPPEEFYESVIENILNTNIALDCLKENFLNQMQRTDPTCQATILNSRKTGAYRWEIAYRIDCDEFNPGRFGAGVIVVENGVCKDIYFV